MAADRNHLCAKIGVTTVLQTCIVPSGGLSCGAGRSVPCRQATLLPERVLPRLFRRLFLTKLTVAPKSGKLRSRVVYPSLRRQRDREATRSSAPGR
jgi:hypothetical protein